MKKKFSLLKYVGSFLIIFSILSKIAVKLSFHYLPFYCLSEIENFDFISLLLIAIGIAIILLTKSAEQNYDFKNF